MFKKAFCPDCLLEGSIELFATITKAWLLDKPDVGLGTCLECYKENNEQTQ